MQRHPLHGDTSLYQVFERINSSGRTLLPQEIRNCVYQGPINSLLFELNRNSTWRILFGKSEIDERMRDMEYILRFFALSNGKILHDEKPPASISLKKHLNQFMDDNNKEELIDNFRDRFISCIEFAYEKFGKVAFHNLSSTDENRLVEKFSPTVFDSVLISIDLALNRNNLIIEERRIDKLRDQDFQEKLSKETMRVPNIRYRVNQILTACEEELENISTLLIGIGEEARTA